MKISSLTPKKVGKAIICSRLESQVIKLKKNSNFTIVAVVGSVGKTSTKLAIAKTLSAKGRVQFQEGNYNDRLTVPLVIFGHKTPSLFNLLAWSKIISSCKKQAKKPYPFDYVVLELGTDHPGDIKKFAYINPDLAVVSAVAEEHMEFFKTLDNVAKEELTVLDYSKQSLVNIDDVDKQFLKDKIYISFGLEEGSDFYLKNYKNEDLSSSNIEIELPNKKNLKVHSGVVGKQGAKVALAAAATANLLGLTETEIKKGLEHFKPFAGRMQILKGINNSIIIDDTYNASPKAVNAALDVLYSVKAPQKIAILGSMNELGDYSKQAHQIVGAYCNPSELNLVITIGKEAELYLAPAAKSLGCEVHSFKSPYEAGDYLKDKIKIGAIILGEGSQNGVFAEESLKILLNDQKDKDKLVRQSDDWMAIKKRQFGVG